MAAAAAAAAATAAAAAATAAAATAAAPSRSLEYMLRILLRGGGCPQTPPCDAVYRMYTGQFRPFLLIFLLSTFVVVVRFAVGGLPEKVLLNVTLLLRQTKAFYELPTTENPRLEKAA